MWLRRAKLVPPIVDVDSDSEPEVINSAPAKKNQSHSLPTAKPDKTENSRISERLKNREDSKDKSLTPRQILLRKHMQNRLNAKKSALHPKNIKSRTIIKRTAKQRILKKVARKNLVSKTMSLRKDLQNKRVTRSANHQIEEMLWANPEKKSKLQSSKSIPFPKQDKKRHMNDNQTVAKKPKLILHKKETGSKLTKNDKETKNKYLSSESNKAPKQIDSSKLVKKMANSAMHTRSSKTPAHIDPKPGCSYNTGVENYSRSRSGDVKAIKSSENKNKGIDSKNKINQNKGTKHIESKTNKSAGIKMNKLDDKMNKIADVNAKRFVDNKVNKSSENSLSKLVDNRLNKSDKLDKGPAMVNKKEHLKSDEKKLAPKTNNSNIKSEDLINVAKMNKLPDPLKTSDSTLKPDIENNLKFLSNKGKESISKNNFENNLENHSSCLIKDEESSVQNNLNLQKNDKNLKKDISELISLNVEFEEPTFIINCEPSCSGVDKEESDKKLNLDKSAKFDSKLDTSSSESHNIKKHNDKKYFKNTAYKDKLFKKISEKSQKIQNKMSEKSGKSHKKESLKEFENTRNKSETKDSTKHLLKKEINKQEYENIKCVSTAPIQGTSNQINISTLENESIFKHVSVNKTMNKDTKESLNKDKIDNGRHSEKVEIGKRPSKLDLKKDFKKIKIDHSKNSSNISSFYNNSKKNPETVSYKSNIEVKLDNKNSQVVDSLVGNISVLDKDSDDDSDYDITLDQYLKLKTNFMSSKAASTSSSSSLDEKVNSESNLLFIEVKDSKVKKDSEKIKKEGEPSKHKKDKSSSKDKSSKKDDKSSKKDSEKSIAKLLKRERSKSSKKEEKERMKHKREGSCSSKSSKRDSEKDGSKLNRKDGERENNSSEKKTDAKTEPFEGKKEKSSKKDSSKISRSNSYEETKSPKKKKRHNELKNIEKIKNLISKSSILNEISGFKEFKRRLSSDKKSKKRKKLSLLKEKKLSKKLSSKLLRKYSKKKGLKKKNKLKKKELKKEKLNLSEKGHSKNKKQKHKTKGDHHKKDNQEKHKNLEDLSLTLVDKETSSSVSETLHSLPKSSVETHYEEPVNMTVHSTTNDTQTCTNDISTPTTYVIEAISDNSTPTETLTATEVSGRISSDLVFSSNDNYQGIVTAEFPGVFDEACPPGAILLTTRDSISQVPIHFIQDIPSPFPKTMADAATNTCEDDIEETLSSIPDHVKNEEMSVGTQTMTPVGSPSPTTEMKSIDSITMIDCLSIMNRNSQQPKQIPTVPTIINSDFSVIPSTSQRTALSNFVPLPAAKSIVSESVSRVLLPVTGGKIQMPTDVQATVSPGKPNMADNSITVPLVSVMPEKQKIPANAAFSLTPVTPGKSKISPNISVPVSPLIPGKPKICSNVNVSLSPATSEKPKMPSNITIPLTALTPEKSEVSGNVNVPLSVTTSGASMFSGNANILPVPPKVTNCVKIPVVSVTHEKLIAPKSASSPNLPAVTPGVSKVSDSTQHPLTPGKSVSSNSVIGPSKTPNKSKASNSGVKQSVTPKEKRRSTPCKKAKATTNISFTKPQQFPLDSVRLVAAPVFYPEEHEFTDPLEYINKIRPQAEQYGICKIVPPASFKPECKVNDDMRFTAHNQYLHKMLYRWGPNVQDTACIRKHLKSQKLKFEQAPLMGGIELDISKFYHTVQQYGGLQQVIEKKRWQKVADTMRVPKSAQDRVTKLYDAYCKYLVSYDLLPSDEKQKIKEEVLADHEKHIKMRNSPDSADEEGEDEENYDCVTKGRSMSLSNFYRIARNTLSMWFKNEPAPEEVEHEFWKIVTERQQRVVVHAGNIDSCVTQSGFPTNRSPFAKHPWNLKVLTNNSRSVLRSMGPLSGITVPTLHVGMLFTAGCWYRDPHSFPWVEYLHTGASKIWYGIPANGCEKFRNAMKKIVPEYCTNKPLWLSSDTAMVPPELLVKYGASLSRTIQNSGQFVVIFPESFTSTICCGYCVSESVYFAPAQWLDLAVKAFQDIKNSYESPAFSLERLLFSIGNDPKPPLKTHLKTLEKILPMIENIRCQELQLRAQLNELGLKQFERLPLAEVRDKKKKSREVEETEQECEICHTLCYISMVVNPQEEMVYCLPHAIEHIPKKNFKCCRLKYTYNESDMNELLKKIKDLVSQLPNHNAKKKTPKKKVQPITEK